MYETVLYGMGFFLVTLLIQYVCFNIKKKKHGIISSFWVGTNTVVVICIMGIVFKEMNYFAAVIGFVLADDIGKSKGWH